MPTYEYRCEKCGHEFERVQKITEKPLRACPKCRGKVQRLLGGGGFILKGGGWYKTDYAGGAAKGAKKAEPCSGEKSSPACASCPSNTEK